MTYKVGDETRGHCPTCRALRFAQVLATHIERWSAEDEPVEGTSEFSVLRCCGCRTVYMRKGETCSEDIEHLEDPQTGEWELHVPERVTYWPAPSRREMPSWYGHFWLSDPDTYELSKELYGSLNGDLRVLAAIGVRTMFDRAAELLNVNPALSFAAKLDALRDTGKIGVEEREALQVLTDAGGAAAHRGWRPEPEQLELLVQMLESFLHRTFILGEGLRRLKTDVPARRRTL